MVVLMRGRETPHQPNNNHVAFASSCSSSSCSSPSNSSPASSLNSLLPSDLDSSCSWKDDNNNSAEQRFHGANMQQQQEEMLQNLASFLEHFQQQHEETVNGNTDDSNGKKQETKVCALHHDSHCCHHHASVAAKLFAYPHSIKTLLQIAAFAADQQQQQQHDDWHAAALAPLLLLKQQQCNNSQQQDQQQSSSSLWDQLVSTLFQNIPLSVLLHLMGAVGETTQDTSYATYLLTLQSWHHVTHTTRDGIQQFCQSLFHNHPFISNLQSWATNHLPFFNKQQQQHPQHLHQSDNKNKELYHDFVHRLNSSTLSATVLSYNERNDGTLTPNQERKYRETMHKQVSLCPFDVTVLANHNLQQNYQQNDNENDDDDDDSVLVYTPKSFPPTPQSRRMVLKSGDVFCDNVVYLARDLLRVQMGLASQHACTRAMSQALMQANSLAVFYAAPHGGITLSCGQHVAQKQLNHDNNHHDLGAYCSTRSIVPLLRNCFVYFEMSILKEEQQEETHHDNNDGHNKERTTSLEEKKTVACIGLSTLEMPLNTLVGAWKGSAGLFSTGQTLAAGQWCGGGGSQQQQDDDFSFHEGDTIGCLVCVDDGSSFETVEEGRMVTACITFNVNGRIVSPQQQQQQWFWSPPRYTLPLLVPVDKEVFPTLTLHSPHTRVQCRFSKEDILSTTTRQSIGARDGVDVFCIDGSVLFQHDE